jgi:hypothetical protein
MLPLVKVKLLKPAHSHAGSRPLTCRAISSVCTLSPMSCDNT